MNAFRKLSRSLITGLPAFARRMHRLFAIAFTGVVGAALVVQSSSTVAQTYIYGTSLNSTAATVGIWRMDVSVASPVSTNLYTGASFCGTRAAALAQSAATGLLYIACGGAGGNLYSFNPVTPAVAPTLVGAMTGGADFIRMAIHPTTGVMYALSTDPTQYFTVSTTNAAVTGPIILTLPGTTPPASGSGDIAFDSAGTLYFVGEITPGDNTTERLWTINLGTNTYANVGALTNFPATATSVANGLVITNTSATYFSYTTGADLLTRGSPTAGAVAVATPTTAFAPSLTDLAGIPTTNSANLGITKSDGVTNFTSGQALTYTIVVSNAGPAMASGAIFRDLAVPNLTVTGVVCASPTGGATCPTVANTTVALMQGTGIIVPILPAGGSVTFTVTGTAGTIGPIANTATVTAPSGTVDPTPANNSATDNDTIVPVIVKAFAVPNAAVGTSTTLTFTLTNRNTTVATLSTPLIDNLSANLTVTAPPITTTCAGTAPSTTATSITLPAGFVIPAGVGVVPGSCTVTVNVTSAVAGVYPNTIPVGALQTSVGNNAVLTTATVNFYAPPTVAKSFTAATINVGGTSVLSLTVTNPVANPGAITTVQLPDTFPAGVSLLNTTFTFTPVACGTATNTSGAASAATDNNIRLNVATLAAGASCQLQANVTSSTPGTVTNTTSAVTATGPVALTGGTASTTLTVLAAPTITKAFAATNIASGGNTNLTVTIGNTNASAITLSALFTDIFPGGMTIGAAGNTGTCTGVTATSTANNFTIANGTSIPAAGCTVIVNVTSSTAGAATNTIAIGALQTSAGNNAVATSATLNVYAPPTVTKTFTPAIIGFGGTSSMIITVSNTAANLANLTGVTINDAYSGTLTNAAAGAVVCSGAGSATLTGGANGGTSVGFNAGTIVPGGNCTITQSVSATSTNINTTISPAATGPTPVTGIAANATLTVATPTVAKTFAAASINDGATTSLIFTLTNSGTNPAQSAITVGDTLPAGLTITSATPAVTYSAGCSGPATAAYNSGTKVLSGLTGLAMTSGTTTCTATVAGVTNVAGQTGTCPQAAQTNLTASVTTTGATNTSTDQCLTVNTSVPTLTKVFTPATFVDGGTTTLRFTLTNNGTNPARAGINFTDNLPSGIRVAAGGVLVSSTCTSAPAVTTAASGSGVITVAGATMNNGQTSCTIDVQVRNTAGQVNPSCAASPVAFTNTTTNVVGMSNVSSGVTPSCAVVTTLVPTIAKAFTPASISIGATSTVSFTLGNSNSVALTAANFTDTLTNMSINATGPAAGTCIGAGSNALTAGQTNLTLTGLTIPANGTCTVTVVVVSNIAGVHPNTTSGVASSEALVGAISNTVNLTVNATPPSISKAFSPATIVSGGVSTLTITITNPNGGPITVGSVTDTLPTTPGTGVVRAATANTATTCAGGVVSSSAGSVTLTGGTVPASGTCTFQIDVTAALNGSYVNTIAINALTTNAGSNAAAATATLSVTPVANVSVTKTGPAMILWGTTISYSVTVTNAGPDAANGSAFSDAVPGTISGVTASCGSPTMGAVCGAVNVAGNNVTSTISTLPAGGTVTFTIQGIAPQSGTLANSATAIVPMGVTDPDDPGRTGAGNNTSNTVMTTVIAPDLQLTETASSGMFSVGGAGSFTLTPNNTLGSAPTSGTVTVTDTLPAGLTYIPVGSGGTGWACSNAMQVVTCTSTNVILAGGTGNAITINVSVASNAVPGVTNTALVSGGNEPAVNSGNNSAVVMVAVANVAMNTFLTDGAQTGVPGTTVLYTHVFTAGQAGTVSFATTDTPSPAIAGWTNLIYRDTNCNGVLDGAEGTAALTASVAVNPGDQVCLVIKSNIPAAAPYNAQDIIAVTATFTPTVGSNILYTRQDVTTVGAPGGSGLTLMKSVRNVTQGGAAGTANSARPGDILEYIITYTNTASATVMMVVISDNTPAFTNFTQASCGMPLPAALTSCMVTVQPMVGAGGNIQWTLTGLLNAAQSGSVIFRATVQ